MASEIFLSCFALCSVSAAPIDGSNEMKATTKKLLEKLRHEWPGCPYQVDTSRSKEDSDVIHLKNKHERPLVLVIDEEGGLTTVSLDEWNDVGGAVTLFFWVINTPDALDAVVSTTLGFLKGLK